MLLFRKRQPEDIILITIDLCNDCFLLSRKQLTIPARVSDLIDILGQPLCVADKNKEIRSYMEMVCKNYTLRKVCRNGLLLG